MNALPASLKTAEISPFVLRASQVQSAKPVIAYWCKFHVANLILKKGLHNVDNDALVYTTNLMDELEQFKAENSTNDTVIDDVAGKAYVEQFGLEVFERADGAVRANNVTRQTADTYLAAATFLDLLGTWPPLEGEIAAKIKYAKYHSLRIIKAVKAGEDPNKSNPKQEILPEHNLPALDPNDAEVKAIQGDTSASRQPSVVEVPDEADRLQRNLARQSTNDESLHPSRAPSLPRAATDGVSPLAPHDAAAFYSSQSQPDVSPIESPSERKPSIGGNYFPIVPAATSGAPNTSSRSVEPSLPEVPNSFNTQQNQSSSVTPLPPTFPVTSQQNSLNRPPHLQNAAPSQPPYTQPPTQQPVVPPQQYYNQSQPPIPPITQTTFPQRQIPPPTSNTNIPTYGGNSAATQPPMSNVAIDEEAILRAQKHARWAISALNFEDVPTAIKELEGALRMLGAR